MAYGDIGARTYIYTLFQIDFIRYFCNRENSDSCNSIQYSSLTIEPLLINYISDSRNRILNNTYFEAH